MAAVAARSPSTALGACGTARRLRPPDGGTGRLFRGMVAAPELQIRRWRAGRAGRERMAAQWVRVLYRSQEARKVFGRPRRAAHLVGVNLRS
jgi:hypothetical protein